MISNLRSEAIKWSFSKRLNELTGNYELHTIILTIIYRAKQTAVYRDWTANSDSSRPIVGDSVQEINQHYM